MDELVHQLRELHEDGEDIAWDNVLARAADEIERLREALRKIAEQPNPTQGTGELLGMWISAVEDARMALGLPPGGLPGVTVDEGTK